jgi:DNA-binding CsgD family transcriptional regulator
VSHGLADLDVVGPVARGQEKPVTPSIDPLDRRIVALVAAGHTNQYIARRSGISVDAVKTRLRRLNARLGTRNRAHVVAWFYRHHLLGEEASHA